MDRAKVQRTLPDPGFAADDGTADPVVTAALRQFAVDARSVPVLVALSRARLLVPVVTMPGAAEASNQPSTGARDAMLGGVMRTDIAAVLMKGSDGRVALLSFTSLATLYAWDTKARPVPVSVHVAARSAVQEGAQALLVDVAGPTSFVVETAELEELAAGHRLAPTSSGYGWVSSDVTQPVSRC